MDRIRTLAAHLVVGPCGGDAPEVLKNLIGEIARVPRGGEEDVDRAVKAAAAAFPAWRDTPVKSRVEVLFRFKSLVEAHIKELSELIVQEHGKNRGEAEAEILKGLETVSHASGLPDLMAGRLLEVSRGVFCQEQRRPLGVVASVVPFNFPAMVPLWTLPMAIACGNCLIMKPSEKVPLTLMRMAELLIEAGAPPGVFSLVHGAEAVVSGLARHPGIAAVAFVGSSKVAKIVDDAARSTGKRSLCLGGAKNHLIAMPDADEPMAINDIMNSAFGSAGQRCMAASVLLVVGKGRRSFLDALVARAAELKAGQEVGEIGPVIDEGAKSRILQYISECEQHGGQVLLDGRAWHSHRGVAEGLFVGPTVLRHQSAQDKAMREEIFGPVLSVLEVDTLDEAIEIENSSPYGNAAAIYTTSGQTALETERLSAGMIGINIGVPVPREPFSFGGINKSKFGDSSDITGEGALNFWTEKIKITSKWQAPKKKDVITTSFIS